MVAELTEQSRGAFPVGGWRGRCILSIRTPVLRISRNDRQPFADSVNDRIEATPGCHRSGDQEAVNVVDAMADADGSRAGHAITAAGR